MNNYEYWQSKLQDYQKYKEKRSINNILKLRQPEHHTPVTERSKLTTCKTIRSRICSPVSTKERIASQDSTARKISSQTTLRTPMRTYTTLSNSQLQLSNLRTQPSIKSTLVSPFHKPHPFDTRAPIKKYLNKPEVNDEERVVFQNFLFNKWIRDIITKKSLSTPLVENDPKDTINIRLRLREYKRNTQVKQQIISDTRQTHRIIIRIRVFCRLAVQNSTSLSVQLDKFQSSNSIVLAMYLKTGDYQACEYLLKQDPQLINSPDIQGDRPIHQCIRRNNIKQLRYILSHPGVDVEAINFFGQTPLQLAIGLQFMQCQKIVLINRASPWEIVRPNLLVKMAIEHQIKLICVKQFKQIQETLNAFRCRIYCELEVFLNTIINNQ